MRTPTVVFNLTGVRSIRNLLLGLLYADLALAFTTLAIAVGTQISAAAAHQIFGGLIAEFLVVVLLVAALAIVDRIGPADTLPPQPVHMVTTAPAVTVTRLADPVHVSNPELMS